MRHALVPAALIALALGLGGCDNMSRSDQRMLSGGAIGAAGGAAVTAIVGGPVLVGAAIGAAAGTVAGHMSDGDN